MYNYSSCYLLSNRFVLYWLQIVTFMVLSIVAIAVFDVWYIAGSAIVTSYSHDSKVCTPYEPGKKRECWIVNNIVLFVISLDIPLLLLLLPFIIIIIVLYYYYYYYYCNKAALFTECKNAGFCSDVSVSLGGVSDCGNILFSYLL